MAWGFRIPLTTKLSDTESSAKKTMEIGAGQRHSREHAKPRPNILQSTRPPQGMESRQEATEEVLDA